MASKLPERIPPLVRADMATLAALRAAFEVAEASLLATIDREFPGRNDWDWLRAVAHMDGENTRRNDDTSDDAALAGSPAIRAAWDDYMVKLHAFYLARDGKGGVLGGRRAA